MARAIVTYCDLCLKEDVYTEAAPTPQISIGRGKPKTLDVCEQHRKEHVDPFVELMSTLGQFVEGARPPIEHPSAAGNGVAIVEPANSRLRTETCVLCGETYQKASGLGHYRGRHPDKNRARVLLEHGLIERIWECEQKGCDEAFDSEQGRRMHTTRAHVEQQR
jgi:hypothetical protein